MNGYTFERRELKYRITDAQRAALEAAFGTRMVPDEHGESTICNIYYDTADYRLIRASLEKPAYKEKLRLRSYGVTEPGGEVFLELKKKYKGIVYKRRITLPEDAAGEFIAGRARSVNNPLKAANSRSGKPLRLLAVEKASQSLRPQAQIKFKAFLPAACTSAKILLGSQTCERKRVRCGEPQPLQTRAQRSGSCLRACQKNFFKTLKTTGAAGGLDSAAEIALAAGLLSIFIRRCGRRVPFPWRSCAR